MSTCKHCKVSETNNELILSIDGFNELYMSLKKPISQIQTTVIHATYIDVLLGILIFAWSITSVSNMHINVSNKYVCWLAGII